MSDIFESRISDLKSIPENKKIILHGIEEYYGKKARKDPLFCLLYDVKRIKRDVFNDKNNIIRSLCRLVHRLKRGVCIELILHESLHPGTESILNSFIEFDDEYVFAKKGNKQILTIRITRTDTLAIINTEKMMIRQSAWNSICLSHQDSMLRGYSFVDVIEYAELASLDDEEVKDLVQGYSLVVPFFFMDISSFGKNINKERMMNILEYAERVLPEISMDHQWLYGERNDYTRIDGPVNRVRGIKNLRDSLDKLGVKDIIFRYHKTKTLRHLEPALKGIRIHCIPYAINPYYLHDCRLKKVYDVVWYGKSNEVYPLRMRFKSIIPRLVEKGVRVKYLESVHNKQLGEEINRAYLGLSSSSSIDYLVGKYFEISGSATCILGNMASDGVGIWGDDYIRIDNDMSNDEMIDIIMTALKDKKQLRKMAKRMYKKIHAYHTINARILDYRDVFNRVIT